MERHTRLQIYGLFTLSALMLPLANPAQARCGDFAEAAQHLARIARGICAGDVATANGAIDANRCQKAVDTTADIGKGSLDWWNAMANNGPAAIGPRNIGLGKPGQGKLVSPEGRLWIVDAPLAGRKTITITHRHGKAGARVHICQVDGRGRLSDLARMEMPMTPRQGRRIAKTVKLENGAWLLVDLRSLGGLGRSLSYEIKVANVK